MKLLNTNTRKELIFLTMRERRDALLKSWNESGILDGLMYDEDLGKVNIEQMLETSIMLINESIMLINESMESEIARHKEVLENSSNVKIRATYLKRLIPLLVKKITIDHCS